MRLKDKVAIVTGGSTGIGRSISLGLAAEGAAVLVNYHLMRETADAVVAEIKSAGGKAISFQADVSNEQKVDEMAACAVTTFGRIDILVNNAAVYIANPAAKVPIWEMSLQEWNKVISVNLTGVFLCCRAVLPQMIAQQSGKIINIGSGHGLTGVANFSHYVACKGAMLSFTKGLAKEAGKYNICANCLAAGSILSEDNADDENVIAFRQAAVASRAIKRIGHPQDCVGCVNFLASSESDFITGQTIVVDGGAVMH
jgi:3-oxoacyl-[acyl-carrier protein] reductase